MFSGNDQALNIVLKMRDEASQTISTVNKNLDSFKGKIQQMQPAFQKMALAGGAAFAAVGLGAKKALGEAVNLGESINAVDVVFKDASDSIKEFGKTAATSVGLSNSEFNQMSTITGALLKDTGLSMGEVADQTIILTKRAADMASVFNTDVNDAMSAINQAIRGETEAIRRYAGDVTDASLQTYLFSQGINKSVLEMTQQEKKLYRVELLMAQTADTANDFTNTQESLANQQRILGAQFRDTAAALGSEMIPMVTSFLTKIKPVIDNVANWIKENPKLATTIVAVTLGLTALVAVVGTIGLMLPALAAGFALLFSPITVVIALIGSLIFFGYQVVQNWEFIKEKASEIWNGITDTIGGAMYKAYEWVNTNLGRIRDMWIEVWTSIVSWFTGIWDGVKQAFAKVIDWILEKVDKAIQKYNELKALLAKPIQAVGSAAAGVGSFFNNAIQQGREMLGFAHGGIVPGPVGQPVPIMAHGQEEIIPARDARRGGSGGMLNITINNPSVRSDGDLREMEKMIEKVFRQVVANNQIAF